MEPNRVGRILGIGARVAAKTLQERTAQATSPAPRQASQQKAGTAPAPNPTAAPPKPNAAALPKAPSSAAIAEGGRRFARGAGRFSAALWKPFAHATGILTLADHRRFLRAFHFRFRVSFMAALQSCRLARSPSPDLCGIRSAFRDGSQSVLFGAPTGNISSEQPAGLPASGAAGLRPNRECASGLENGP